ncbi:ABC transporter [Actibacterium mucosum KCTC 23349]|uniref:ABC transporter n=1 Tax=Actibacterium mucosum KCTC 23349 TaxID=1454373 RepID=A0A037ZJ84_9RHOB|nr:sugar ABC transporter ATP-binding protein [Actibacterium mucosum]KAJ56480.1 ABC transporter [Actibacterium mucosum KCTC 23349]
MQDIIEMTGISKRFGVVQALAEVDLSFRPAEVLALVGENGAGKSTLMRILEGVFPPDTGAVVVDGTPAAFAESRDAHAAGIRVIHQEPEIVPDMTVAENIFVGDMPRQGKWFLDRGALNRRTAELLAEFGMSGDLRPTQKCDRLGPAQRQMIEIIRAVRAGGRLIAFDEPTSSLTDDEARRLFRIIRRLRSEGTAVIYISHRLNEVIDLADRISVLRDGRIVSTTPVAEETPDTIAQKMVGRELNTLFHRTPKLQGELVLEVANVSSAHVQETNLQIRAGEVVGLGGLMGAGRSELAKAIFGFDRTTAGTVRMGGKTLPPGNTAAAIQAGIGFAPEDRKHESLLLMRSILENGSMVIPDLVSTYGFFNRSRAKDVVGEAAKAMKIKAPSLDTLAGDLSGGNQQKVVLARWLARSPKLLILDEPTRGIDVGAKSEIYKLIDDLASRGIAILLISSEMPELIGLSDRALVMADGRIQAELAGDQLTEQNILKHAMPETATAA